MSFPTGHSDQLLPVSAESTPPSTDSTDSTVKAGDNPYRHILTHQEKKKQRMPKRKADSWPTSILTDPDVLSLDDEGRFVLCKVCHVHYAVHGGKKPKPVIMNSSFRTRAWEVHKERTNSHRLHKKPGSSTGATRRVDEEEKNSESPVRTADQVQPQPPGPPSRPVPGDNRGDQTPQRFSPPPASAPQAASMTSNGEAAKAQLSPRRRPFRPMSHGPPRPWDDVQRRNDIRAPRPPGNQLPAMTSQQADGLMRWQNMHDDVSRALGSMHKRPVPDQYGAESNPSMRLPDTEDFGEDNERVAKKLKSLDDEYDATVLKRQEAFFDRRSDMYKQYWGTLRDVYNSNSHHAQLSNSNAANGNKGIPAYRRQSEAPARNKESIDDFTTMDDSAGSSEDMVKPVVVHDQALINALDRLTGVISKQYSHRHTQETSLVLEAVGKLAHAVDDLRVHHGTTMSRLIQLQEQKLHVMEELLRLKLDKARNHASHQLSCPSSSTS